MTIALKVALTLLSAATVAACASNQADDSEQELIAESDKKGNDCRKVHVAGTRFPKTICGTLDEGLTEVDKERLRDAIGRPIVTEKGK